MNIIRKLFFATSLLVAVGTLSVQAQFKNLGKVLEKSVNNAVDKVAKNATDMATDATLEIGANKASDQIIEFMDNNNTIVGSNSKYATRLDSVLAENFKQADSKALDIQIYDTPEANVITLNNGNIRIYSGMMDMLTDEELRSLIALQAGHIEAGNIKTNLLKAVSGDNIDDMTEVQLDKVFSFSGSKIKNILNEILQLPYTREQNASADIYAKKYLKKNGGSESEYSRFISKVRALNRIDLDSKTIDADDEAVKQASIASSFLQVNASSR